MKTLSPVHKNKFNSLQRQSLTVKTDLMNHFDSRWAQIKITGKNIQNRSNHTAVINQNYMFIHGGYDVDKGILSDFYKIDLTQQNKKDDYTWTQLSNICQSKPIKLKNHKAITYQNKIFIYGGQKNSAESSNITYIYNINTNTWTQLKTKEELPKVDSHCMTVVGSKMYVYGGYMPEKAMYMNDVWVLDLEKQLWEKVYNHKGKRQEEPENRSNCDMVGYKDVLYIFGGSNGQVTLNDFWKFSLTNKKWEKVQTQQSPSPRRGHSMLLFDNYMFMFGGIQDITKQKNDVYIYDFVNKNWKKIHTTTNSIYDCSPTLKRQKKQSIRSPQKVSLVRVSPQKGATNADAMKKILNQNKQKKFQQRKKQLLKQFSQKPAQQTKQRSFSPTTQSMLKTLEAIGNQQTSKKQAKQQIIYDQTNRKIIGKKPCARDGQTVCVNGDFMYIFGGDRHLMAFNDLYSFDLAKGIKSLQLYNHQQNKSSHQQQNHVGSKKDITNGKKDQNDEKN